MPNRQARTADTGERLDALPRLLVQGVDRGSLVSERLQIQRRHDEPFGVEPQAETFHVTQATDKQARPGQQNQRECYLSYKQRRARAGPRERAFARAGLERRREVWGGRLEGRGQARQHGGEEDC